MENGFSCPFVGKFPGHVKNQTMQTAHSLHTADRADWGIYIIFIDLFIFIINFLPNFSLLALNSVFLPQSCFPAIFSVTPLWKSRARVNRHTEEQFWRLLSCGVNRKFKQIATATSTTEVVDAVSWGEYVS